MIPIVLTVAGSDPSGGAGIQADLKTFSALGVYGMAVIAALTAQNTLGVQAVMNISGDFVGAQLESVLSDIPPQAVKTGMLGSAAVVEVVASKLRKFSVQRLVIDPVMVSSSGAPLLDRAAIGSLKQHLFPLAELVTPNLAEAAELSGMEVRSVADMEQAARRIHDIGARNVLVKGGHLEGEAVDVFYNGVDFVYQKSERILTNNLHGTGCVLSAAVVSGLALGHSLSESITLAKRFVTESIRESLPLGKGCGPVNPLYRI